EGREAAVVAVAHAVGFPLAGSTPIGPLPRGDFLDAWLDDGRAGEMRWLERRRDVRRDPRVQFPWARSLIVVGVPYPPPPPAPVAWRERLRGRMAAYTAGPDYHRDVRRRLDALAATLAARFPGSRYLSYVDTGAIVEREWAERAGIGWIGRNTLV